VDFALLQRDHAITASQQRHDDSLLPQAELTSAA
jgi:hypothetical protein